MILDNWTFFDSTIYILISRMVGREGLEFRVIGCQGIGDGGDKVSGVRFQVVGVEYIQLLGE